MADSGLQAADTSWILTCTALVLLMTLPGLAMFYGGLVRSKNVLSILLQCFSIAALMSVLWLIVGYSIAFSEGNDYFGGFSKVMFAGVLEETLSGGLPESLFALFQMTFAIITPALIIGGFAERIKFSAVSVCSVPSGCWWSMRLSPTGSGAEAGWAIWGCSILPVAQLCISPPVSRRL